MRVQGRSGAVHIFTPLNPDDATALEGAASGPWPQFLAAYRRQDWDTAEALLAQAQAAGVYYFLCHLYAQRIASLRKASPDPAWDGSTHFDTK